MNPNNKFPYSEEVLQWVWKNLLFDISNLKTTDGKQVEIYHQGQLNTSNGPDFLHAKVSIDGIVWYGAIELHLSASGWVQHNHHLDEAYNQVVLHVVVEHFDKSYYRKDGGELPTLNLQTYLKEGLSEFLSEIDRSNILPCSSNIKYLSEEIFLTQIEKAHKEYLDKKGNDFLSFYNTELVPSISWKQTLVITIFDGFGISHNRKSMQQVAKWFLKQNCSDLETLIPKALDYAGFGDVNSSIHWNFKGVYPANQPKVRIPQAIKLSQKVLETPFEAFLNNGVLELWSTWIRDLNLEKNAKSDLLFATVFIPSVYVLGSIFHSQKLTNLAYSAWHSLKVPIPKTLLKPFQSFEGINAKVYENKLGIVHQLNAYCNTRRCHECLVLKKVILS